MNKYKLDDMPPAARTLLIPLAYRAAENRRPDAILRDEQAAGLFGQFEEDDFVRQLKNVEADMDQVFTMLRTRQFDRCAQAFLGRHPDGTVVDIGCGLDTRFYRIDNGSMRYLGLDLPQVIEVRRRLLPESPRLSLLCGSVLDFAWMDQVSPPAVFIAEGVLVYLDEPDVKRLLLEMHRRFPGAEFAFDVISRASQRLHQYKPAIRKAQVHIGWSLDDTRTIEAWVPGLRLLEEDLYLTQDEPRLGRLGRLMFKLPAMNRTSRILHLSL